MLYFRSLAALWLLGGWPRHPPAAVADDPCGTSVADELDCQATVYLGLGKHTDHTVIYADGSWEGHTEIEGSAGVVEVPSTVLVTVLHNGGSINDERLQGLARTYAARFCQASVLRTDVPVHAQLVSP